MADTCHPLKGDLKGYRSIPITGSGGSPFALKTVTPGTSIWSTTT